MYFYSPNHTNQSPYPYRNEFIYRGNIVWIGTFNCHHTHAEFKGINYFDWNHMVVFPRTSVALDMTGYDPVVGSPNVAILYNHGATYERGRLTDEGDCCEYFFFSPQLLGEALAFYDPAAQDRPTQPFLFNNAPVNNEIFINERKLVDLALRSDFVPSLEIDELAIEVLESLLKNSFAQRGTRPKIKPTTLVAHRELVYEAQKLLVTRYHERLTLEDVAKELYVSPYHLSRVFRQQTGRPLYQFLEQLRLRNAFERLGDFANDLNRLALDTGYASHSHFTAAFRRHFGVAPSHWSKLKIGNRFYVSG